MNKDFEKRQTQEMNYRFQRVTEELAKKPRNLEQLNVHMAALAGVAQGFNLYIVEEMKRKQGGGGPGHWTEV